MNTTTTIRFSADTVRTHGLTIANVHAMLAETECVLTVTTEADWQGQAAIVVSLTTDAVDGDAASDELVECADRTGIPHMVGYTIAN